MVAYVYKILFADGRWYYGIRRIKDQQPHQDRYYGSPVTNKEHWKVPHSKIVLKCFKEWQEAAEYENQLIQPDLNNPLCLNECANLVYSQEVNRKAREKAVAQRKGTKLPAQHCENISKGLKGRPVSSEELERLRTQTLGMSWWNNGVEEVFVRTPKGQGWIKGRLKGCFKGSSRTQGWKWYHRGEERKMFKTDPGDGWQLGRKGYNSHKKSKQGKN